MLQEESKGWRKEAEPPRRAPQQSPPAEPQPSGGQPGPCERTGWMEGRLSTNMALPQGGRGQGDG